MSKFQSPLLNFGEAVLAKGSGAQEGRGQTGFVVGSGHLDGTVDEDKRTSCRHTNWSDQGPDCETTS